MGQTVEFPSNGDTAQGYLAIPDGGSGPGVVVIQEWWGLNDNIREITDRYAAEGLVALAPALLVTGPAPLSSRNPAMAMGRATRLQKGKHQSGWRMTPFRRG